MIECPRPVILQIFGSLMRKPDLISQTDKYRLTPTDFSRALDRYIYSTIYNLYINGAKIIHITDLDIQIQQNPNAAIIYNKENGLQLLKDCEEICEPENFDFYYNQFRKINLLRDLQRQGRNINDFYCENPLDPNYFLINENFEKLTCKDIVDSIKNETSILENKYVSNKNVEILQAYEGVEKLIEDLKSSPEVGAPIQGDYFNTITRGARLGKLYLRSASSGVGKSRTMVGDSCLMAYPIRYDRTAGRWVLTGSCEKVVYIATEQDIAEIQTMILAYLTDINEECFLYGQFNIDDMNIILKAIDIMKRFKDNLWLVRISDPCATVVTNVIRQFVFEKKINYFFYDYIFSCPAMLNEYRDLKLREDVVLRLFTTQLKDIAIELNIFIMTSTQISNDNDMGGFKSYKNIQGSKAIVNLCDFACVMSRPSPEEISSLRTECPELNYSPNIVIDVFKNRRGRWTQIRIWGCNDLGTCRRKDVFVTNIENMPLEDFKLVDFKIEMTPQLCELEEYYNDGVIPNENKEELVEVLKDVVHASQNSKVNKDDSFFITEAFDNKIDLYKKSKTKKIGDYF